MKNKISKKIRSSKNSTNIMAGRDVTLIGLSYKDAKEIALDVYRKNFLKLSEEAYQTATKRAEKLIESFLKKLLDEDPSALNSMRDPGMQIALFAAQKEYSRLGDDELHDILVDLLVQRAMQNEKNLNRVVLDECLNVIPKLMIEQLDILTIHFVLLRSAVESLRNKNQFKNFINSNLAPFIEKLSKVDLDICFEHLEYAGCGSIMRIARYHTIEETLQMRFPLVFCIGFSEQAFNEKVGSLEIFQDLVSECSDCNGVIKSYCIDSVQLANYCKKRGISEEKQIKAEKVINESLMSVNEIRRLVLDINPSLNLLLELWNKTAISRFDLTTVGTALAKLNFKRKIGIDIRDQRPLLEPRPDECVKM